MLKPDNSELVWGSISFVILLVLFFKWGYPAVVKTMKAREDRIKDDLEGAEGAKTEAETVLNEYRAQLADARAEAGRIIDEARQAADQVRRDLIARAETDAADLRARAQEDIRLAGSARWPTSGAACPISRSSWPRRSSSATSTATRRSR